MKGWRKRGERSALGKEEGQKERAAEVRGGAERGGAVEWKESDSASEEISGK